MDIQSVILLGKIIDQGLTAVGTNMTASDRYTTLINKGYTPTNAYNFFLLK